jgi:hypothetical protein
MNPNILSEQLSLALNQINKESHENYEIIKISYHAFILSVKQA